MLKSFKYTNLNGKFSGKIDFNEDLNILTGQNGCGKTTILKALWYLYSGNIHQLARELTFDLLAIHTFQGSSLTVENHDPSVFSIQSKLLDKTGKLTESNTFIGKNSGRRFAFPDGLTSLFFPTFRRMEGGFSIKHNVNQVRNRGISDSLHSVSKRLSVEGHRFVATVAAQDVDSMIKEKFLQISSKIRAIEKDQSKEILQQVSGTDSDAPEALEIIRSIVENGNEEKSLLLKPFDILSTTIDSIFKNKSVDLSDGFQLGSALEKIPSEKLSSGEKQMLSFLCYNFFYDNTVIFIDEPELSLHVDWQRQLFPTLMKQGKRNQFIVSTHSPFIYSKYPDKEIIIHINKGEQSGAK